jgi:hypothetical protein
MPGNRIRYVKDIAGTRKLMTSPQMQALLVARAEAGAAHARSIAPRQSGDYADSIKVTSRRRGGPRNNRAEARITATVPYANDVEVRHRVLGRTVDVIERGGQ